MKARIIRTCSTMIGLLLLVAVPTQAGPIRFGDVINVMSDLQTGGQLQQLRLRAALQEPTTTTQTPSTSSTGSVTPAIAGGPLTANISAPAGTQVATAGLTSGIEVTAQQPQSNVQVFTQDSADGTICDCGEIPAAGGIPIWPFLLLIPLVCVTGVCSHHHNETPTPPPSIPFSPTPPSVPEPTSILLLGSGILTLTAAARRRHKKGRARRDAESEGEAE
jgi:PEP-CTERM motif-containing protein